MFPVPLIGFPQGFTNKMDSEQFGDGICIVLFCFVFGNENKTEVETKQLEMET